MIFFSYCSNSSCVKNLGENIFELYNMKCISTKVESACDMNSSSKNYINHHNIALKLAQKIKRKKKSRIKSLVDTCFLRDSFPQNPKFLHLDSFLIFHSLNQIIKKIALA